MFSGQQIVDSLTRMGVSHVVLLPDSTIGPWEADLRACASFDLVRVCREGEAWVIAAGLHLGGARPLVMIQCTGLFESGDAMRNVVYDYKLPLFAIIGYRSYLNQQTLPGDTCLRFTEPILHAWDMDHVLVDSPSKLGMIAEHYDVCRRANKAGAAVIAEGAA